MSPRRSPAEAVTGSGDLAVSGLPSDNGTSAQVIQDGRPRGFWAVITAHTSGNAYGFARLDDGTPTTFPELDGAAEVGDGTLLAAYEVTGRTDVPTDGTVKVWLEPLRGAPGLAFFYPVGIGGDGSGTDGNCTGDGWRIGLTADDEWALRVLPDGESIFIEDDGTSTVEINGVEYTIDFDYAVPSLTLTSSLPSAAPIVGTLDCSACPCLKFAFPRSAVGLDEAVPRGFCARVLYVTVCQYCPAGVYCAREAGTTAFFEPVELLEGEACADDIEVLPGGPYESVDIARMHCGETLSCSPGIDEDLGARNVFTMPISGMVTPGCDYNFNWRMVLGDSLPIPNGCVYDVGPEESISAPFMRIGHATNIANGHPSMRLRIEIGPYAWQYWYDEVVNGTWDWRSSITFTFDAFLGGGSPFCDFPASITIYPV